MAINSSIEWTEATWNPVAGCTLVSPGCRNCYAMRMAYRLESMGQDKYVSTTRRSGRRVLWSGVIRLDEASLELPYRWKKGKKIFVNSMSDLFHEKVPLSFIRRVFDVIRDTRHHTYQILTKRSKRLKKVAFQLKWPQNLWMGVSVENGDYIYRIDELKSTGSYIKYLSLEPLIGPLDHLNLVNIDWVIVGGESGPGARLMRPEWVRSIRDQCVAADVPFHFKQWGGVNKKKHGRELDGRYWDEFPPVKYRHKGTE